MPRSGAPSFPGALGGMFPVDTPPMVPIGLRAKLHLVAFGIGEALVRVTMALLLIGATAAGISAEQSTPHPASYFEPAPCPCDVPPELQSRVHCGYLSVPEDRQKTSGKVLRLAVAVIHSSHPRPAPDPVVYLEGGPGGGTLAHLADWVDAPLLRDRDLILFDQRGSGFSEPDLWCSELEEAEYSMLDKVVSPDRRQEAFSRAAQACASRLERAGVDLSCYNTAAIAADVEDLRRALGYARWNLYGVSYGTRVTLVSLRDFPQGIRSVVMDSCVPLEVQEYEEAPRNALRAFDRLFQACREDPSCHRVFPDLEGTFAHLVERFNADPLPLEVTVVGAEGEEEVISMAFSGNDLLGTLFQLLYDHQAIPYIPLLIERLRRREYTPLGAIASDLLVGGLGDGLYLCVECRDEALFNWSSDVAENLNLLPPGRRYNPYPYDLELCAVWPSGNAPLRESFPVASDLPALVMAGGFDPVTPPEWSRMVARTLPNAFYVEFPSLGHGVSTTSCGGEAVAAFFRNPLRPPAPGCLMRAAPLSFALEQKGQESPYGIADPESPPPSQGLLEALWKFLRQSMEIPSEEP